MTASFEDLKENLALFNTRMLAKAHKKSVEKGRPLDPWNRYDLFFLQHRLLEEFNDELLPTFDLAANHPDEVIDKMKEECLDVANFCAFIYLRLEVIERMKKEEAGHS